MKIILHCLIINLLCLPTLCMANECNLSKFRQSAANLDNTKLSSVISLANILSQIAAGKSEQCRSKLLGEFSRFYRQSLNAYQEKETFWNSFPLDEVKENQLKLKLKTVGWELLKCFGSLSRNQSNRSDTK